MPLKRYLILCIFIALSAAAHAQLNFTTGTWSSLLAQAKAENKLIFVDVYTDWCSPCKVMDKTIFTLPEVGNAYNGTFINYKLNAEKGEGVTIRQKYAVGSYPNYMFIDGDGTLIYRAGGAMPANDFIRIATNAIAESRQEQTIVQMEAQYPSQKTDKVFMYNYLTRLVALKLPSADLLDEYIGMLTPAEQAEPDNIKLIVNSGDFLNRQLLLGVAFDALKRNQPVFEDLKSKKLIRNMSIRNVRDIAIEVSLSKAIANRDEKLFNKVWVLKEDASTDPFSNRQMLAMQFYYGTGEHEKYKAAAKNYINNFLLKIPADTLAKWDNDMFQFSKAAIEERNDPSENTPETINSYKHTQTMNLTRMLSRTSETMLNIPLTAADLKMLESWTAKSVAIAAADTASYQDGYPLFRKIHATVLYKAGQKQLAIKQMQALIEDMPQSATPRQQYIEVLETMRANKDI
ncbi:MAG: DUF255 domain-containing protein [Sphingobacteriaceae bacterium]|nr:MAG: DUF255 domain-containing protein [Sphingobacteriaceae bacterium]